MAKVVGLAYAGTGLTVTVTFCTVWSGAKVSVVGGDGDVVDPRRRRPVGRRVGDRGRQIARRREADRERCSGRAAARRAPSRRDRDFGLGVGIEDRPRWPGRWRCQRPAGFETLTVRVWVRSYCGSGATGT